jgi:hypothetical protein
MPRKAKQPVRVPTGLPYGEGQALRQSQSAQPLPQQLPPTPLEAAQQTPAPTAPITAPSTRPGEPLTTGLPTGPGAGPEALGSGFGMTPLDELKALYAKFPTEEIRQVIQYAAGNP